MSPSNPKGWQGLTDALARHTYGELGHARIGVAHPRERELFAEVVSGLGVTGTAAALRLEG
ncbi:hypothetical protein [Nocardia sp. R7R-8]|uniref:hypothetical protein n=1 Tax=Nocardia sp. R7R-8 TaxID=3459304 RepID=UPI00403E1D67